MSIRTFLVVALVGIVWSCVLGLQRPPPRYSQQYMPDTSFTCRNKIVGSYYADPETDCQLFHVCVSVAGSIQDYKFLCPNDTAFDQESQTCADYYDVDCEEATLYYASDNFDLYRLGSGLESLHYDSLRSDAEPQDHLQRSESSDPVRSANNLNSNSRDILRGSSSINFYNSRNGGKDEDYDTEKTYKEEPIQEPKRKTGVRKVARKQNSNTNNNSNNNNGNNNNESNNNNNENTSRNNNNNENTSRNNINSRNNNRNNFANNYGSSSTIAPVIASSPSTNYNGNFFNYNRQRTTSFQTTTAPTTLATETYNVRNSNSQKYNAPTTTQRPSTAQQTYSTYQSPSTTLRTTVYNNYNTNNNNNAYSQQQSSNSYGQSITSPKPTTYSQNYPSTITTPKTTIFNNQNYPEQQNYNAQYSQFGQNTRTQTTTVQPSTNYQANDYTNYQRNYNNIQRTTVIGQIFPTTPAPSSYQDTFNGNNNHGQYDRTNEQKVSKTFKDKETQSAKISSYNLGSGYVPTTYRPSSNNNNNNNNNNQYTAQQFSTKAAQYFDASRGSKKSDGFASQSGRYNSQTTVNDNGQYSTNQQQKSTQYYDSTRAPKKATQYNANYDITNNGKYFEASTSNYDFARSQAGIGFSPSSINHLAESPRTTTPVPKRNGSPTTYSPQSFNVNQRQTQTTPRGTTYVSGSARPFSTTARPPSDATTQKPKSGKKNDYDYAYYDNVGGFEYDGLDLEHVVAGNKESSKISRN